MSEVLELPSWLREYALFGSIVSGTITVLFLSRAFFLALSSKWKTAELELDDAKSTAALNTDQLIDMLTDGEGDSVTFFCSNPDFNELQNEGIEINASWTNWENRRFSGDTRAECLTKALEAMKTNGTHNPEPGR